MNKIESALANAIEKHNKLPLVIAYSGGVDSQVLLHALASLIEKDVIPPTTCNLITVCHVNHGLSDNAPTWQSFAEDTCFALGLKLIVSKVNIHPKPQQSLEALARDARYKVLQAIYEQSSLIITGHHSDDQAETFMLALKRGSGLKGLSAMASETKQGKDILLRPLLNVSRAEIMAYANKYRLKWVEDESNIDTRYDRNFIRNDVMPLLVKRWPSVVNTINRSSEHCREGQLLLNELAEEDLNCCLIGANSLSVDPLAQLSQARFNNLVRYYLAQNNCLMPSTEQLSQLRQQLAAKNDKNPSVKVGEHYLRRFKGALYLTKAFEEISDWELKVDLLKGSHLIELPDQLGKLNIDEVAINYVDENSQVIVLPNNNDKQKLSIRFSHENPTCLPDFRNHSRHLKKILQELNIPPWQRKRIPFLYLDNRLVAAIGFFICQEFLPEQNLAQDAQPTKNESKHCLKINWHR